LRYSPAHTRSFDVGATASGGYSTQGSTSGEVATRGANLLGVAHTAIRFSQLFTGGLYVQAGAVEQQTGTGSWSTTGTVNVTGAIAFESKDDPPTQ